MTNRIIIFNLSLALLSLILAILLGLLDFFGFLSGAHTLNFVYLALSFVTWHLLGLTIFLLNLDKPRLETVYLVAAVIFGTVFFLFNQNYLSALLATCSYFFFQIYTEKALSKRAKLFVNYSTREVVFPIIRQSFLFLLLILVTIGFFQGQRQVKHARLITPYMVRTLSKPIVIILNKQLGTQLQQQLEPNGSILENLSDNTFRLLFGFNPQNIPLDKTIIYPTGEIDLTPVVNEISDQIAFQMNQRLNLYLPIIPLFFAFLVFLFVSPLVAVSEILLLPIIRAIIALLISLKIITVSKQTIDREVLKLSS